VDYKISGSSNYCLTLIISYYLHLRALTRSCQGSTSLYSYNHILFIYYFIYWPAPFKLLLFVIDSTPQLASFQDISCIIRYYFCKYYHRVGIEPNLFTSFFSLMIFVFHFLKAVMMGNYHAYILISCNSFTPLLNLMALICFTKAYK